MKSDSREHNIIPLSLAGILFCLPKLVLGLSNNVFDGDGSDQAIVPMLLRNLRIRGNEQVHATINEQVHASISGQVPAVHHKVHKVQEWLDRARGVGQGGEVSRSRRGGDGDLASVDRDPSGLVDGDGTLNVVGLLEFGTEVNFKFSKLSETKYLCCQVSKASSVLEVVEELGSVGERKVLVFAREGVAHVEGVANVELHSQATEELAVDDRWEDKRSKVDGCPRRRSEVELASLVKGRWEQPSNLLANSLELFELNLVEIQAVHSAVHLRLARAQCLFEDLDDHLVRERAEHVFALRRDSGWDACKLHLGDVLVG
jgi:hypothetical protein